MIRVALLCNDRLCLPAVNWLVGSGLAVAVGMPAGQHETLLLIRQQCQGSGVPFQQFSRRSFATDLQHWLQSYQPDVVLVKTFPWLIPAELLTMPSMGFINFHFAPLPAYRGPAPLFWMIRNQVRQGGVTVHRMDQHFDTGPVLLQQSISIQADFTYGMLVSQLAFAGLHLCALLLQGLTAGGLQPMPQEHQSAGWYRRPQAADLVVNWERMSAPAIRALVLACNPWNKGAGTSCNNWVFGLTDVAVVDAHHNGDQQMHLPGTIISVDELNGLLVSCLHNQLLRIDVIYCEEGFFPGYKLSSFGIIPGLRLGHYTMPAQSFQPPSPALHQST
jgi:methionyl-tRNA formyltransferase